MEEDVFQGQKGILIETPVPLPIIKDRASPLLWAMVISLLTLGAGSLVINSVFLTIVTKTVHQANEFQEKFYTKDANGSRVLVTPSVVLDAVEELKGVVQKNTDSTETLSKELNAMKVFLGKGMDSVDQ